MSALSSAKELAQLFERAVSQHLCSRAPTPLKTSRDWCTMRVEPFPFSRFSLTFLSLLLKNPTWIIKRTWLYSAKAARRLWWQIRWDRDDMHLRMHSGPGRFYNPLGTPQGPDATAVYPRLSISPHSSSNPPRVLLINAFAKATEVFWLVFCAALQAKEAHCS